MVAVLYQSLCAAAVVFYLSLSYPIPLYATYFYKWVQVVVIVQGSMPIDRPCVLCDLFPTRDKIHNNNNEST